MHNRSRVPAALCLCLVLMLTLAACIAAPMSDVESGTLPESTEAMTDTVDITEDMTDAVDMTDGTSILTETAGMTETMDVTETDGMTEGAAMDGEEMTAVVTIEELDGSGVSGEITFVATASGLEASGTIEGLEPGLHGFHAHENGDCGPGDSDNDGQEEPGGAAGGHFNPDNSPHGGLNDPEGERHVGDFGNVEADDSGTAEVSFTDDVATLSGTNSIVGKAIIVHANEDDLVTQPDGNSGPRVGCGILEMSGS